MNLPDRGAAYQKCQKVYVHKIKIASSITIVRVDLIFYNQSKISQNSRSLTGL